MTEKQSTTRWLAPAKLNLFLHITGRRADGYHNLQTVFQFIDLYDYLTIDVNDSGKIQLLSHVEGVAHEDNIIVKAAKALQARFNCTQGATIAIEKNIPMGAGLGGGSSNAATTLIALNQLWNINASKDKLMTIGLQLGADVPVFIFGKSAWAEGIGEELSAIELSPQQYVLAIPYVHCSTQAIFSHPSLPRDTKRLSKEQYLKSNDIKRDEVFQNDMQEIVCQLYPEVEQSRQLLMQLSLQHQEKNDKTKINVKMTGTGAGVFVRIEPAQIAEIRQNLEAMTEKLKKTSIFFIKSLSIHPHW